jgi:integrase
MIRVQRLAGLRPQHVAEMRVCDLDRSGEIWRYTPPPAGTKTLHLDKRPAFYFGPRSQTVLLPFLAGKSGEDHVFTWTRAGKVPKVWRVSRLCYSKVVKTACEAAKVKPWTPHQLRHALATEVAARFSSIEHAAAAIGDSTATAAAVYVHIDPRERAAIEVARAMG